MNNTNPPQAQSQTQNQPQAQVQPQTENQQQILRRKELFFDRWAPNYDALIPTIFYQAIHKRLVESISLPQNAQVLDLGCGTGKLLNRLASQFPDLQGIGLDLSEAMVDQARQLAQNAKHGDRLQFQVGEAGHLAFRDGTFDAVFNTISFLHYPEPQRVLREIYRVLRPGGHYYLADLTVGDWLSQLWFSPNGVRFYGRQEREQLGAAVGLVCERHVDLLGPALLTDFVKPGGAPEQKGGDRPQDTIVSLPLS